MRATLVDPHSVGRATPLGYGHAVLLVICFGVLKTGKAFDAEIAMAK
jgi:hypothetical protein